MAEEKKEPTLEERLAAARARSAAAAKKNKEAELLREVEAEECAADLRERYGDNRVAQLTTVAGPVVLLRPEGMAFEVWKKAVARAGKSEVPQSVTNKYIFPAIKYPADPEKLLEDYPAMEGEIVLTLSRMFAFKPQEDAGK